MPKSSLIGGPRVEASWRLTHRALLFGLSNRRHYGHCDRLSNFVLNCKNVGQIPVIRLGPDVLTGAGLYRLGANAGAITGFSQTSLKDIPHAEFTPHFPHVHRLSLVGEAR